jgi:hypothetical protein
MTPHQMCPERIFQQNADHQTRGPLRRKKTQFALFSCHHTNRNEATAHAMANAKVIRIQVAKPSRVCVTIPANRATPIKTATKVATPTKTDIAKAATGFPIFATDKGISCRLNSKQNGELIRCWVPKVKRKYVVGGYINLTSEGRKE